jgi:hypothetical protein
VKQCDGVTASVRGETTLGREKRGGDASWANANLTRSKNKENPRNRFSC